MNIVYRSLENSPNSDIIELSGCTAALYLFSPFEMIEHFENARTNRILN